MGDPTGVSAALVAKLVDWVIEQATTAIHCKENCRALNERLHNIRPLVYSVATDLSANGSGTVVAGLGPVKKWLEDLENLLRAAGALVLKCQATVKGWTLKRRNELSKQILNIKQKIEDICTVEAPLALLNIEVGTARGVDETLKVLAQLPFDVGNEVQAGVQEIFQPYMKEAELVFQEIKEKLAILVTRGSDQTSSFQQTDHEAEIRPVTDESFGVDDPLEKLLDLLLRENMMYVGLCGTGGVGKTRLAELAYNSKDVKDNFERRIWLTVGNDASIEGALRKLADKLEVKTENLKRDEIKSKLFNKLRGMKVLLVLDDIWDKGDPMLEMLNVTSGPDTGSKILVTTRHVQLLNKEGALDQTVRMKGLSRDDSWTLFREFAFKGVDTISNEMEILAKEVAAECKGLPLALKVVARALAGKLSHPEWKRALKKLQEAKPLDKSHETQLYQVLQYSYDELESVEQDDRLQKCFIYFASFPEDSEVSSEKLVSLWAGDKLLEAGDENDHGYALLWELIDRSLIENLSGENRSENVNFREVRCRIHDVLRDFARLLIREKRAPMKCLFSPGQGLEKFPGEWLVPTPLPGGLISEATHLSLNDNRLQSLPEELNLPKLEVLLLANNRSNHPLIMSPGFLENFSSLKVLDLESTWIASLPKNVGNLMNLTYLKLHLSNRMLPSGVCDLSKLEYLGLCGPKLESLPNLFVLKELRKLSLQCKMVDQLPAQFARKGAFPALKELRLECDQLKQFPPTEHGAFPKLQILSMKGCTSLKQLGEGFATKGFPALKVLELSSCSKLEEFPPTQEGSFPKLETLWMEGCGSLKQLRGGFASKGVFPVLKVLQLSSCSRLEEFPPTQEGSFPKLETLCMQGCGSLKELGERFASKGVFPVLKVLQLSSCSRLEEFPPTQEGSFPKLETLCMQGCGSLKELGGRFASEGVFPVLKVLQLSSCSKLEEFPLTQEGSFPKLETLCMEGCGSLKQLHRGFASKGVFPVLKVLQLGSCSKLEEFPPTQEGSFPKLETLWMEGCGSLKQLGAGFASKGVFPVLKVLQLTSCSKLEEFPPTQEGSFPKLEILWMRNCRSLKQLDAGFASKGVFPVLKVLELSSCCKLEEFPPTQEGSFPKLEILWMRGSGSLKQLGAGFASKGAFPVLKVLDLSSCSKLEEIPPTEDRHFQDLKHFGWKVLELSSCSKLDEFRPTQEGSFPKLETLWIQGCGSLKQLSGRFASKGVFPDLKVLQLGSCSKLEEFPPTQEGSFPKLETLWMQGCGSLKQIGGRFASKGIFPVLKVLELSSCSKVEVFPPTHEGSFPKLETLCMEGCGSLSSSVEDLHQKAYFRF